MVGQDRRQNHEPKRCGVAETPTQFRHVVEIHAVYRGDLRWWQHDECHDGDYLDDVRLLDVHEAEGCIEEKRDFSRQKSRMFGDGADVARQRPGPVAQSPVTFSFRRDQVEVACPLVEVRKAVADFRDEVRSPLRSTTASKSVSRKSADPVQATAPFSARAGITRNGGGWRCRTGISRFGRSTKLTGCILGSSPSAHGGLVGSRTPRCRMQRAAKTTRFLPSLRA